MYQTIGTLVFPKDGVVGMIASGFAQQLIRWISGMSWRCALQFHAFVVPLSQESPEPTGVFEFHASPGMQLGNLDNPQIADFEARGEKIFENDASLSMRENCKQETRKPFSVEWQVMRLGE